MPGNDHQGSSPFPTSEHTNKRLFNKNPEERLTLRGIAVWKVKAGEEQGQLPVSFLPVPAPVHGIKGRFCAVLGPETARIGDMKSSNCFICKKKCLAFWQHDH